MVIKIGTGYEEYKQLVPYGRKNNTVFDKLCALLLAIAPILQHYKGLYENAGFTVLLIAFPILTLRFFLNRRIKAVNSRSIIAIIPLLLFELYSVLIHSSSFGRLLYVLFMIWIFVCIASGCVNVAYFMKCATTIVSIATVLLVVQYISHYLLHYTINLRPLNLLVSQNVIWVRHALTYTSTTRLYRPAAFFLEPSHLFLYSFPLLCILLLTPGMNRWRRNKAIIISIAMLLTTSGFSIVIGLGLWIVYFLLYRDNQDNRPINLRKVLSGKTFLILIAILIALILAFLFIPIFRRSVVRIFEDTEGTNAIDGRIRLARNYIQTITGKAILIGTPNVTSTLDFNLAGFFATYIKYGIIGLVLSYWFYGRGIIVLKRTYRWMSAIIVLISFFTAHTHGTFYMLYYVVFLMNGYCRLNIDYDLSIKSNHSVAYS